MHTHGAKVGVGAAASLQPQSHISSTAYVTNCLFFCCSGNEFTSTAKPEAVYEETETNGPVYEETERAEKHVPNPYEIVCVH